MSDLAYEIPVPANLGSIVAINDGNRWISQIIHGSVSVDDGVITFVCKFAGKPRRFTMLTELVGGYQTNE